MLSVKIYNAQGVLKTQPGQNGSRGEVIRNQADLPALSSLLAEEVQAHQERIRADDMKERGGMLVMGELYKLPGSISNLIARSICVRYYQRQLASIGQGLPGVGSSCGT
jgi:hypothetical protein